MAYLQQVLSIYNGKIYECMGTDNQIIFNDLKTLNGVLKRIEKYNINKNENYIIYQYNDLIHDFYNNKQKIVYKHIIDNKLNNLMEA